MEFSVACAIPSPPALVRTLPSPILLRLAFHRRSRRVLHLEPGRASGRNGRASHLERGGMVASEIIKITPRGIRNLRPLAGMRAERLPNVASLSSLTVRPRAMRAMSGLLRSWYSSVSISPFAISCGRGADCHQALDASALGARLPERTGARWLQRTNLWRK